MKKLILTVLTIGACGSLAAKEGDLIVRARAIAVSPDESTTSTLEKYGTKASSQVVPELDLTYMVTNNIGAELILGTSRHKISTEPLGNLGKVSVLPPTLTVQYHFSPEAQFRPYVGAGINYTRFYNNDLKVGNTPVRLKNNSFGPALQVGADFAITKNLLLNVDVKKIFIHTKASLNGNDLGTLRINPWVFGIGIGRKFSF